MHLNNLPNKFIIIIIICLQSWAKKKLNMRTCARVCVKCILK